MSTVPYTRLEVLRTFRNVRFFLFSIAFPLVLFYTVAGTNRHSELAGIPFPLYYMAGMASWGAMASVMAGGARISLERSAGWTRQMRITPLSMLAYFRAKVLSGYVMAIVSLALLFAAGLTLGVRLSIAHWFEMTGLMLVGLIPFVVLGILLGHLLNSESMGPALGGIVAIFALLGGAWGPLARSGALKTIAEDIPSYWLVQAAHVSLGAGVWGARGWIVLAAWTAVLLRLTVRVYRRDTARV